MMMCVVVLRQAKLMIDYGCCCCSGLRASGLQRVWLALAPRRVRGGPLQDPWKMVRVDVVCDWGGEGACEHPGGRFDCTIMPERSSVWRRALSPMACLRGRPPTWRRRLGWTGLGKGKGMEHGA